MPPQVQNNEDEPNPHDVLLPSMLAQWEREHVIDANAVAQLCMQPTSGEGEELKCLTAPLAARCIYLGAGCSKKKHAELYETGS